MTGHKPCRGCLNGNSEITIALLMDPKIYAPGNLVAPTPNCSKSARIRNPAFRCPIQIGCLDHLQSSMGLSRTRKHVNRLDFQAFYFQRLIPYFHCR